MINFKKITFDDLPDIKPFFDGLPYRTCDFTVGGLYLWEGWFDYEYCICRGNLFIRGRDVTDCSKTSYALPLGGCPLSESVGAIIDFARENHDYAATLNAVPEDALSLISKNFKCSAERLDDWSDYLYNAEDLAYLRGKKFNKKRNRVNLFMRDHPDFAFKPIDGVNIGDAIALMKTYMGREATEMERFDNLQTLKTLENFDDYLQYGFSGGVLYADGKAVAFTIGETLGDTLYTHIEKADTGYEGAYQTVNMLYSKQEFEKGAITLINREDDVGDEGLRQAKLSYHPVQLLYKYKVTLEK